MEAVTRGRARHGDLFRLRFGRSDLTVVCCPDLAHDVLVRRSDSFVKLSSSQSRGLGAVLGRGLLTSPETASWFEQRRLLQPLFAKNRVAALAETVVAAGERLLASWTALPKGSSVNVTEGATALMREVLYAFVFSLSPAEAKRYPLEVPLSLATSSAKRVREARSRLDEVLNALIRRRGNSHKDDLLGSLLRARDAATGEKLSKAQLHDELLTVFAAGLETTASALVWTWVSLARSPAALSRMRAELSEKVVGRPSLQTAEGLSYTSAIIQEVLRRYPTIPSAPRISHGEAQLGPYRLPEASKVLVSLYALHHHPDYWTEPERFSPERFLPGIPPKAKRAYVPFGLGRRACTGRHLALLSLRLVVPLVAQRAALELPPEARVPRRVAISLAPRYPVKMLLSEARVCSEAQVSSEATMTSSNTPSPK